MSQAVEMERRMLPEVQARELAKAFWQLDDPSLPQSDTTCIESLKATLESNFERYANFGVDQLSVARRKGLLAIQFEKLAREIGLLDLHPKEGACVGPGDIAVVFERYAIKHKSKQLSFSGFLEAVTELSFLRFGYMWQRNQQLEAITPGETCSGETQDGDSRPQLNESEEARRSPLPTDEELEQFPVNAKCITWCIQKLLCLKSHPMVSKREEQSLGEIPREGNVSKSKLQCDLSVLTKSNQQLVSLIYRYYAQPALSFESYLNFTKHFEILPQLCSRRAVADCFRKGFWKGRDQSQSGLPRGAVLSRESFLCCLIYLAREIFAFDGADSKRKEEDTTTKLAKLIDLLSFAGKPLLQVQDWEKARVKEQRHRSAEQRRRQEQAAALEQERNKQLAELTVSRTLPEELGHERKKREPRLSTYGHELERKFGKGNVKHDSSRPILRSKGAQSMQRWKPKGPQGDHERMNSETAFRGDPAVALQHQGKCKVQGRKQLSITFTRRNTELLPNSRYPHASLNKESPGQAKRHVEILPDGNLEIRAVPPQHPTRAPWHK